MKEILRKKTVYPSLSDPIISRVFSIGFLHPTWCLAHFLSVNAGANPPVSHHCDLTHWDSHCWSSNGRWGGGSWGNPKRGGGSGFKLLLDGSEDIRGLEDCQYIFVFCGCHDERLLQSRITWRLSVTEVWSIIIFSWICWNQSPHEVKTW